MRGSRGIFFTFSILIGTQSAGANPCSESISNLYRAVTSERILPEFGLAVATVVVAEDKVLMVKRISGEWGFVGGNYEPLDQSILGCAERETGEEIRAKLKNFEFKIFQKIYIKERDKTYVTAILTANPVAERIEDVQITLNPREAGSWGWFSWDKLPKPLFPPNQQLIEQGFNPFH